MRGPKARQAVALGLLLGLLGLLLAVTSSARLERADLVINNGSEPASLDPGTVTGVPEGRILRGLFEGLTVKHPRTLEPLPGVALTWELSPDGRVYTFELRPDACWIVAGTDPARFGERGDPLTADDFEWSWKRLLHPLTAAEYAYQLWPVRGARQFTELPIDRVYATDRAAGAWLRTEAGVTRVGLTGFRLLDAAGPDGRGGADAVRLLVAAGDRLRRGAPWLALGDTLVPSAVDGLVRRVQPQPAPTVAALASEPYESGWLVELEPPANGEAQSAGFVEHERFRDEVAWPGYVGIRAETPTTLVVELAEPTPYFLHLVSFYPLFPVNRRCLEEARERWPDSWEIEWMRPENLVTNGPFRLLERRVNDRLRLVKNPVYWDADRVAMNTIDVLAVEHYGTMLNLFLTGEVDWIDRCAPNLVHRLIQREDFTPRPYLGTYFYRVNVKKPPLDDVRVRRALALTIDRRAITDKIMKKGERPNWALVPHGIPGYTLAELEHAPPGAAFERYEAAFAADVARAKELLAEAGYGPGGKDFPTIEIHYNTSEAHRDVAEVVADGWKRNLRVDAKLLNQEWKVYLDTQRSVDYDVSRSAWIGDYPDPNTFLDIFVTGGENNRTHWGDPRYDALIEEAAVTVDATRRMELLHAAETILMEELPILPVYTYATQNLKKPRLGGFYENVLDEHFPKFFYWMDDAELAERRAAQPPEWERAPAGGPRQGLYPPAGRDEVLR